MVSGPSLSLEGVGTGAPQLTKALVTRDESAFSKSGTDCNLAGSSLGTSVQTTDSGPCVSEALDSSPAVFRSRPSWVEGQRMEEMAAVVNIIKTWQCSSSPVRPHQLMGCWCSGRLVPEMTVWRGLSRHHGDILSVMATKSLHTTTGDEWGVSCQKKTLSHVALVTMQ